MHLWILYQAPQITASITVVSSQSILTRTYLFYHLNPKRSTFRPLISQAKNLSVQWMVWAFCSKNIFLIQIRLYKWKNKHSGTQCHLRRQCCHHLSRISLTTFIILKATDFLQNQAGLTIKKTPVHWLLNECVPTCLGLFCKAQDLEMNLTVPGELNQVYSGCSFSSRFLSWFFQLPAEQSCLPSLCSFFFLMSAFLIQSLLGSLYPQPFEALNTQFDIFEVALLKCVTLLKSTLIHTVVQHIK